MNEETPVYNPWDDPWYEHEYLSVDKHFNQKPLTPTYMNSTEFNDYLDIRLGLIQSSLTKKQHEYADNENVFRNFEQAGVHLKCSREKALWGMMMKHYVSVEDMVQVCETGDNWKLREETIKEKLGDIINYFILLEIMLLENESQLPF